MAYQIIMTNKVKWNHLNTIQTMMEWRMSKVKRRRNWLRTTVYAVCNATQLWMDNRQKCDGQTEEGTMDQSQRRIRIVRKSA